MEMWNAYRWRTQSDDNNSLGPTGRGWACFSYTLLTYPYYVFAKFLEINFLKLHISINKMWYTFFNNYTFNQWGSQQGVIHSRVSKYQYFNVPNNCFRTLSVSEWVSEWLLFNAKWAVFSYSQTCLMWPSKGTLK